MFTRFKNRMLDKLAIFVFKTLARRYGEIVDRRIARNAALYPERFGKPPESFAIRKLKEAGLLRDAETVRAD